MTNEVMASDLGVPTFEPTVACAGYCYGGVVRMHPTEYPQFTSVADVWVKGDAVAALRDKNDALMAQAASALGDAEALRTELAALRADVEAFREDAANYYRVAKEADAQQAALRARVAELEAERAICGTRKDSATCARSNSSERENVT